MIIFLLTEAIEILLALGKVSYNGIYWLYSWYFNQPIEEQKKLEMKTLEERIEILEQQLKQKNEDHED